MKSKFIYAGLCATALLTISPSAPVFAQLNIQVDPQPTGVQAELFRAIDDGDENAVRRAISRGAKVNAKDPSGDPVLQYAVQGGSYSVVQLLLRSGAKVNETGSYGSSALGLAVRRGQTGMVKLLLAYGANVTLPAGPKLPTRGHGIDLSEPKPEPVSPLTEAAAYGRLEILQTLIKHLKRPWTPDTGTLIAATKSGNAKTVGYLIKLGAPVNGLDEYGQTALQEAAMYGRFEVCKVLLEAGANPNIQDKEGSGPLTSAAIGIGGGPAKLVKLLLDHGAEPNGGKGNKYDTPLAFAVKSGDLAVVKLLLARGADPNRETFLGSPMDGPRPLIFGVLTEGNQLIANMRIWGFGASLTEARKAEMIAKAQETDAAIVRALLDKGANVKNGPGQMALISAAAGGNLAVVKMLAEHGAPVNVNDRIDEAPMHPALQRELDQEIKKEPENAAEIRKKYEATAGTPQGVTPLLAAASKGNSEILTYLLSKGADVKAKDKNGFTALMYLAGEGRHTIKVNLRSMREGVLHRADEDNPVPRPRDISPRESAIWAAWAKAGDSASAQTLLTHGADSNAQNLEGVTALMKAAATGNLAVAQSLLGSKADPNLQDAWGTTALMRVITNGRRSGAAELFSQELETQVMMAEKYLNSQDAGSKQRLKEARQRLEAHKAEVTKDAVGDDMAIMSLLLAGGANREVKNKKGQTALDLARGLKYEEAINTLKN